jgi:hypothetical protein
MNLTKLGFSSWLILLNIVLLVMLVIQLTLGKRESYVNYAQQVDPSAEVKSNPEVNTANTSYASILMFLQKNPTQSAKFISDIKKKFFNDTCTVKDTINFNTIAQLPDGMVFS